ncbi:hypothetical protein D0Z07_2533 [Hyphodiscus hymeniophilus]|uniref:BTB domain-containing protein n=1 Tax=Hyphodiscus hymeniophilus TaxID=353542 RepID=A0A9P6VLS5_9HELO|nr:hypothetical protein D0Z07_2533 [Hyphodiscus hymeniophilus]
MARIRGNTHVPAPDQPERSLDAEMRAPSTTTPDVVVLDFVEDDTRVKEVADPKKDLWLSSVDGRHQSAIIPVRVGPTAEVFSVHRDVLIKSEYFRMALDGEFREADDQAIDLPEEDPAIFSFVIAFLYEGTYVPIKTAASVLVEEPDKGKGKESDDMNSGSEDGTDSGGSASDESIRSQRRRERRTRRQWEQRQRKELGRHRPDCQCIACVSESTGPACWNCGMTRRPTPPRTRWYNNPPHVMPVRGHPTRPRDRDRRRGSRNNVVVVDDPVPGERMSVEDLRTWAMAYSLSVEVYVCADRFLMPDFKTCVSACIIDNFEIAGLDAALPAVLQSCKTLNAGLSPMDPLLKKVFARVGFLQARLWKNFREETDTFFKENPELSIIIMKEMMERREEDNKDDLPAMERPLPVPLPRDHVIVEGPGRRNRDPYVSKVLLLSCHSVTTDIARISLDNSAHFALPLLTNY